MKHLLLLALLVGCQAERQLANKADINKWGQSLIDCPTAEVVVTSWHGSTKLVWSDVDTFYIVGCGLKVCCSHHRLFPACFPCKKEQWY
jgi:hypothetical protein